MDGEPPAAVGPGHHCRDRLFVGGGGHPHLGPRDWPADGGHATASDPAHAGQGEARPGIVAPRHQQPLLVDQRAGKQQHRLAHRRAAEDRAASPVAAGKPALGQHLLHVDEVDARDRKQLDEDTGGSRLSVHAQVDAQIARRGRGGGLITHQPGAGACGGACGGGRSGGCRWDGGQGRLVA